MNRKLIYYCLAIGLPQVISFVTLLILSSYLGSELYAKIAIFETVIFFLQATIGLALGRSASRFYIDGDGAHIISLASILVIFSSLVLFLVSVITLPHLGFFYTIGINHFQYIMLYISSLGYILTAISLVKYQFENETVKYLLLSVFKTAVLLGSVYVTILVLGMNTDAFPVSHFFAGLLLILMSILINKPRFIMSSDIKLVKDMLSYSLPFVPTLIAAWIMTWSNRFFMVNEIPLGDVGIYSIIQRFCMVYFIFTQAVSVFITPVIYRKLKQDMKTKVSSISIKIMALYFVVNAGLFLFLSYFLVWYYDYDYSLTLTFVGSLMVVNLLSSVTAISTNILFNYYKKTLIQMYIYLSVACLSLVLNYYLIPQFKMYGVFFSLVVPLVVLNLAHVLYFFLKNEFEIIIKVLFLVTVLLFFMSVSILTYSDVF